jgi:hypothetical protein
MLASSPRKKCAEGRSGVGSSLKTPTPRSRCPRERGRAQHRTVSERAAGTRDGKFQDRWRKSATGPFGPARLCKSLKSRGRVR